VANKIGDFMLKNYLKTAIRNLVRYKTNSIINIIGLAIGLTCSILIFLFIKYELSYDDYHANADNIHRIVMEQPGNLYNGTIWWYVSPFIMAPTMKDEIPEVLHAARILQEEKVITHNQNKFIESKFFYADPEFLNIFTFPLLQGEKALVLEAPFSIVLTKEMSYKYFDDENPIGKTLLLNDGHDYQITGVLDNVPKNSHFTFDFLASISSLYTLRSHYDNWLTDWFDNPFNTFVLLRDDFSSQQFDERLKKYSFVGYGENVYDFHSQPITNIHLHGKCNLELETNKDIKIIYIFASIAIFILIIASTNFINLLTARLSTRTMEVGVRKVLGAKRKQLIVQFLGESMVMIGIGFFISLILVYILLPGFANLIQSTLTIKSIFSPLVFMVLLIVTIIIGLLSSFYPAFVVSNYESVKILKKVKFGRDKFALKNLLVLIQFIITISLIISTLIINTQLKFMQNKELGYTRENIITTEIKDWSTLDKLPLFKTELLQHNNILNVAGSHGFPNNIKRSNMPKWDGQKEHEQPFFYRLSVDEDFFDLYGIELTGGREFSKEFPADKGQSFILNEAAIKALDVENPMGMGFGFWKKNGTVIGTIKNFHYMPLNMQIQPLGIGYNDGLMNHISIKISGHDKQETIAYIKSVWDSIFPSYPFEFSFLQANIDQVYKTEISLAKGFVIFTWLAIAIACLGLFGLVSHSVQLRVKEIGIRKVLGATISNVTFHLIKNYTKWILLANLIAWPTAYILMDNWLQNFAYRIDLTVTPFIISAIIAFVISLVTISFQAINAALSNPIDALKYE